MLCCNEIKQVHILDINMSVKLYNVVVVFFPEFIHPHWRRYHSSSINAVISGIVAQIDENVLMKII